MTAKDKPCIPCAGKGFRWGRGRTGEPRMVKRKCGYCKGSGRVQGNNDGAR